MTTNAGNTSGRTRGASLLIVLAIALTAVVAVGVGVEFYVRDKAASCLEQSMETELGGPVDVGFGATPLLFTALSDKVSKVSISAPDANISTDGEVALKGIGLDASFTDVTLPADDGTGGVVGGSSASILWPEQSILESLQTLPFGGLITGATLDAASNTMQVQALGGVGSITLRPGIAGGAIAMTTTDVSALGIGLPNDFAQQIIDVITRQLGVFPLGLAPQSISVTDAGLRVELRGGRADLPVATSGGSGSGCSLL